MEDERILVSELQAFLKKYIELGLLNHDDRLNVEYYYFDDLAIPCRIYASNLNKALIELNWKAIDYNELEIGLSELTTVANLYNYLDDISYRLFITFI